MRRLAPALVLIGLLVAGCGSQPEASSTTPTSRLPGYAGWRQEHSQTYWYCWNDGHAGPHHLGYPVTGDHLCSDGELAAAAVSTTSTTIPTAAVPSGFATTQWGMSKEGFAEAVEAMPCAQILQNRDWAEWVIKTDAAEVLKAAEFMAAAQFRILECKDR